jgi:Sulfotransferase family
MSGGMPSLRQLVKAAVGPAAACRRFEHPIFILAPPRSGSTFLFECLSRCEEVMHLQAEADVVWWRHFPYEGMADPSDQIDAAALAAADRGRLCRDLYREVVINHLRRRHPPAHLGHLLGLAPIRYLDKTIANCFHLDALERLFPDARYVFLVRGPRANIASMIEGWPYGERFGKPQLTPYLRRHEARTIEHWTYPAPPGWQAVVSWPLAEICAWSWQQHVEAALAFCARRAGDVLRIRYEELAEDPLRVVRELAAKLELSWSEEAARYVRQAPLSRTTVTRPSPGKWQDNYAREIARILPLVQATAGRIGYGPEPMAPTPRVDGDHPSRDGPAHAHLADFQ